MDPEKNADLPITEYLAKWHQGSPEALEHVIQLTYEEIHQLALSHFHRAKPGDTLCPTALLNEAYLQLSKNKSMVFQNRHQFFWFFSRLMRNTIVDQIRVKLSKKRDANWGDATQMLQFKVFGIREDLPPQKLLDLDRALRELAVSDPRPCRVVEGYFFAGLTMLEIAELENISLATVKRDLRFAKKWLAKSMDIT